MNLSIIIPFFNEQSRFSKTVKYIRDFLDTQKFFDDIELIFVDDGSTDNTRGLIDEFAKQISIKTIAYKKNMGKGYAVRQGMMAAKSDYALFLDADMSTEPEEISSKRNRKIHGGDKKRHTCDYRLSTFKRQPSIGFSIPASNNDGHDFYNAGKSNYGYAGSGFHLRI